MPDIYLIIAIETDTAILYKYLGLRLLAESQFKSLFLPTLPLVELTADAFYLTGRFIPRSAR